MTQSLCTLNLRLVAYDDGCPLVFSTTPSPVCARLPSAPELSHSHRTDA